MHQLESVSKGGKGNSEFVSPESKDRVTEMYLLDELEKYERAAEELKEELARLDYFQQ
jgi:transcription initiation factor IIE alpha subunit